MTSNQATQPSQAPLDADTMACETLVCPNYDGTNMDQKRAIETASFSNTMIVSPTVSSVISIADFIIYNYYRWYPNGKLLFISTATSILNRQMMKYKKISDISAADCINLTQSIGLVDRKMLWAIGRIFFSTPQMILNDLLTEVLPAKKVRLVVIIGTYEEQTNANIIRYMSDQNQHKFRVLVISTAPGSDIENNKHIMLDLSLDAINFIPRHYEFAKSTGNRLVELPSNHKRIVEEFLSIYNPLVCDLHHKGFCFGADSLDNVSWRNSLNSSGFHSRHIWFKILKPLKHLLHLLRNYGLRVFYRHAVQNEGLPERTRLMDILDSIKEMFGEDLIPDTQPSFIVLESHPKLPALNEMLIKYFNEPENARSKVIVFTKYPESVSDIIQATKLHSPILRPGRCESPSSIRSLRSDNMRLFTEGILNILVSTHESGKYIYFTDVDLIICYDICTSIPFLCHASRRQNKATIRGIQVKHEHQFFPVQTYYYHDNYSEISYKSARMLPPDINPTRIERDIFAPEDR